MQTPLNNNIRELFNLMNFLDPDQWKDLEQLSKQYEELTDELVKDLHNRLKPYFLRRIKSEVLQLPPKVCLVSLSATSSLLIQKTERSHCSSQHGSIAKGDISVHTQYGLFARCRFVPS